MGFFRWLFGDEPSSPAGPIDRRDWNDDWQVGDTAECIAGFDDWHPDVKPWHRLAKGTRLIVSGFMERVASDNTLRYFLQFEGLSSGWSTDAFRKVRPVASEKSEIVERILTAKPGKDKKRIDA